LAGGLVFAKGAARFTKQAVGINVIAKIQTACGKFVAGRPPNGSRLIAR
jgi:hypothetical protein